MEGNAREYLRERVRGEVGQEEVRDVGVKVGFHSVLSIVESKEGHWKVMEDKQGVGGMWRCWGERVEQ